MHSPLLQQFLPELKIATSKNAMLDLACGAGRNGIFLAKNGLPVVFADRNEQALDEVKQKLAGKEIVKTCQFWQVDFEDPKHAPLADKCFGAVIVFRYLHRPLIAQLKQSVESGGMVIYETFTRDQAELGRPKRDEFLLKNNELKECFFDWDILHYFEGVTTSESTGKKQAIAQIVAIKP
jgi:SAM-dependent methyltransferase